MVLGTSEFHMSSVELECCTGAVIMRVISFCTCITTVCNVVDVTVTFG